jgi:hypothetical protein
MRGGDTKNAERAEFRRAINLMASVRLECEVLTTLAMPLGRLEQCAADYLRGFCLGREVSSRW